MPCFYLVLRFAHFFMRFVYIFYSNLLLLSAQMNMDFTGESKAHRCFVFPIFSAISLLHTDSFGDHSYQIHGEKVNENTSNTHNLHELRNNDRRFYLWIRFSHPRLILLQLFYSSSSTTSFYYFHFVWVVLMKCLTALHTAEEFAINCLVEPS